MGAVTPHGEVTVRTGPHSGGKTTAPHATRNLTDSHFFKAVVNNFHHKVKDLEWLKSVPYEEVGTCDHPDDWAHCGDRVIGESLPWLEWMHANFDHLPTYTAFLHGDQFSWHAHLDAQKLVDLKPDDVEMLAEDTCLWPRPARPSNSAYSVDRHARLVQ